MDVKRMTMSAMCRERNDLNAKQAQAILYGSTMYGLSDDEAMRLDDINMELLRRQAKIRRDCSASVRAFA